jgi:hypothetical protein
VGLLLVAAWGCTGQAFAAEVTLAWDPNDEPTLEGYGVYFRRDKPGSPFKLFGYVAIKDLDDPNFPTFTITGLKKGASYYFAVTAYDSLGNESAFSDSICAEIDDEIAPCSDPEEGGNSSGGGGVGCFIETATGESGLLNMGLTGLAVFGCLLAGIRKLAKRRF